MKRILITGASGNVGEQTMRYLHLIPHQHQLLAGVRNVEKSSHLLKAYSGLQLVHFDFDKPATFAPALADVDTLFLLRPPHISNVEKYFKPLIQTAVQQGVKEVLFISVQGAEKSSVIPHYKIEKLLLASGLDYIFLRPSYFMQNLSTTLLPDIRERQQIIVPAGKALFNWLDVANLGEASALLLLKFENYKNKSYEITGIENLSFAQVAAQMSQVLHKPIKFKSAGLLRFYLLQRKRHTPTGMIIVMILLHYLPRFQDAPKISYFYEELSGHKPTLLKDFIQREYKLFA